MTLAVVLAAVISIACAAIFATYLPASVAIVVILSVVLIVSVGGGPALAKAMGICLIGAVALWVWLRHGPRS